jgi:hypothetical protein
VPVELVEVLPSSLSQRVFPPLRLAKAASVTDTNPQPSLTHETTTLLGSLASTSATGSSSHLTTLLDDAVDSFARSWHHAAGPSGSSVDVGREAGVVRSFRDGYNIIDALLSPLPRAKAKRLAAMILDAWRISAEREVRPDQRDLLESIGRDNFGLLLLTARAVTCAARRAEQRANGRRTISSRAATYLAEGAPTSANNNLRSGVIPNAAVEILPPQQAAPRRTPPPAPRRSPSPGHFVVDVTAPLPPLAFTSASVGDGHSHQASRGNSTIATRHPGFAASRSSGGGESAVSASSA